ncbi:nucleotidyltransferase domain-containing protein [Candidatus Parvarchaeota archaeon]|nr:nucleotidyltransferase domain-containing protein [Candidatus Parvarchaeota archaeon]
MEEQCDLFLKVLTKFHSSGVLDNVVLIGSWSTYFYKDYFSAQNYYPTIKTTDMDFLVPLPIKTNKKVDIAELLRPDDFKVIFSNSGFIQLEHPGLTIEFLVPEHGKGTKGPFLLPQFGISAQPLKMLDILAQNTIAIESNGIKVTVPHPAAYGLRKLIVSQRRTSKEKMLKDQESGLSVLHALIEKGESDTIKAMFNKLLPSWREKVLDALTKYDDQDVMRDLKQTENIEIHRGRHR